MHRRIEMGLGMLLALVVANGAQAGPRDGRLVPRTTAPEPRRLAPTSKLKATPRL